jgi:hypothetical protein
MNEILKLGVGVLVLILGVVIGNILAKSAKDELKDGQKYFRIIIILGIFLGVYGLIFGKDAFLFTGFFVSIVTSRSLKR